MKMPGLGYVMFYIGYENIDKAQICAACSEDGITRWKKLPTNPLVTPTADAWDADAYYKPSFLWNEESKQWMLWYNGRKETMECIGFARKYLQRRRLKVMSLQEAEKNRAIKCGCCGEYSAVIV